MPLSFCLLAGLPMLERGIFARKLEGKGKEGECLPVSIVSQHLGEILSPICKLKLLSWQNTLPNLYARPFPPGHTRAHVH